MIRFLLLGMTGGLLAKLAFAVVIAYWFPLPPPDRPAWNTAKEEALAGAMTAEDGPSRQDSSDQDLSRSVGRRSVQTVPR